MATARKQRAEAKSKGLTLMKTTNHNAGSPAFLSIRQAAWSLGVTESCVCAAVRGGVLRAVWRRSRLVVPATELRRVLDGGAR
jgi:hypothetical protein